MTDTEFAKTHLREHLAELIISPISEGFWSIASSARELCERNKTPDQVLRTFQNMLTKVPEWSETTLNTEVERIQKVTKCSYLDDLLMGVFIAYMKSFASLHYRGGSTEIKVDFDRPSLAKFVHELYKHSARKLWQVAYLFKVEGVRSEEQARNRQEVESTIGKCLEEVIRSFLPWSAITKKYFSEPEEDIVKEIEKEESEEEDEKPIKSVSFGEDDEEDEKPIKSVSFGEDDEEDEDQPKLQLSEEETTLDLPELAEEEDPMKELEKKAQETLVLNL